MNFSMAVFALAAARGGGGGGFQTENKWGSSPHYIPGRGGDGLVVVRTFPYEDGACDPDDTALACDQEDGGACFCRTGWNMTADCSVSDEAAGAAHTF